MSERPRLEKVRIGERKDIGLYPYYIYEYTDINPINVFDIGAWDGDDAIRMKDWFQVLSSNVYCFEPNPFNFENLSAKHPTINKFNIGLSNCTGKMDFLCHEIAGDISSFKPMTGKSEGEYKKISIDFYRMDDFINQHNITQIDICKIDVEGLGYEVLEGFGDKLKILKSVQIEAELKPLYMEQKKFFDDIKDFLIKNEYTMVDYCNEHLSDYQCDSLWIRNEYLKNYGS